MAEDMNVPFLGSLPLDPRIGKAFIQFAKTSAVVFKMNYMYLGVFTLTVFNSRNTSFKKS